jgi:fumarate reductase flavoprotein subunit
LKEKLVDRWNQEADILVVGGGPGGLRAAVAGLDAGVSVLVLERMDSCLHCAAAISGGTLSFAGTEEQKAEGVEDSVELYTRDVLEVGEYGNDPEIVRAFMDRQLDTYYWLKKQGVKFLKLALLPRNTIKRTLSVDPMEMMAIMQRTAERSGAKILFNTRAKRLVTNQEGEVIGVQAESQGKALYFKSRRATILATGGFGRSPEWMDKCHPGYSKVTSSCAEGATGDGLLMALELGAELRNLPLVTLSIGLHRKGKKQSEWSLLMLYGAIFVNKEGKRFINEADDFRKMGDTFLEQPDAVAFQIADKKTREAAKNAETSTLPLEADALLLELQDDTIEGLAGKAGINPAALRETVNKYNSYVEAGMDPEFGRAGLVGEMGQLVKINTPPFYAFPTVTHIPGTSVAGLVKDVKCRAINVFGEVIPRLYVTGELAIGFHGYKAGISGSAIVMAIIDGIIAAENAVAQEPIK